MKITMIRSLSSALMLAFSSLSAATAWATERIIHCIDVFTSAFAQTFAPEPFVLADGGTTFVSSGRPLSRSLINSMRHEAGVPRLSAPRGC